MGTKADLLFFVHHHIFPMGVTRVVGSTPAVSEAGTHARQVESEHAHNFLTPNQNHPKHEVEENVLLKN